MTKEEFIKDIEDAYADMCPKDWRKGQFIFNYLNEAYGGVARHIQFTTGIDCFFDDRIIGEFIDEAWSCIEEHVKDDK